MAGAAADWPAAAASAAAYALAAYGAVVLCFRKATGEHVPWGPAAAAYGPALAVCLCRRLLPPAAQLLYPALAAAAAALVWRLQVVGPSPGPLADLSGRRCVITGANSGIGAAAARRLAALGAHVVLACRTQSSAEVVRREIATAGGSAEVVPLDLSSLASVRSFAQRVAAGGGVDILVNNAGVMMPQRRETADGVEATMAVNFIAPTLLTLLLLRSLAQSHMPGGARVVNVNSASAWLGPNGGWPAAPRDLDLDDMMSSKRYEMFKAYGQSKLCFQIVTEELHRRLRARGSTVCVNALHPGTVQTAITREMPRLMQLGQVCMLPFIKPSVAAGSHATVHLAAAAALAGSSGGWYEHCAPAPSPAQRYTHRAEQVWVAMERIAGVSAAEAGL
eukprot:TRINITY_DN60068_c0_g1_i1.p1 TRINITY_DN60068_c0_g1~~TRINITY_DN60068_c0_g1_i1.p1  ORF type:complete len:417 (+),score=145.98 TRINITY_DN60068_c0_g1_i1:76-1251(+)